MIRFHSADSIAVCQSSSYGSHLNLVKDWGGEQGQAGETSLRNINMTLGSHTLAKFSFPRDSTCSSPDSLCHPSVGDHEEGLSAEQGRRVRSWHGVGLSHTSSHLIFTPITMEAGASNRL